jgi:hypothetical protein
MPKTNNPTELLVRANALRLLWKLFELKRDKKDSSGYAISEDLGISLPLVYKYLNIWAKHGLVNKVTLDGGKDVWYWQINPKIFDLQKDRLEFDIDGITVSISRKP